MDPVSLSSEAIVVLVRDPHLLLEALHWVLLTDKEKAHSSKSSSKMARDQLLLHNTHGFVLDPAYALELDSQQLLADTDALLQSLLSSSDVENAPAESATKHDRAKEKAGQRRNVYRRRLKTERLNLRRQEVELSNRLKLLKQRRSQQPVLPAPRDRLGVCAWKAVAMRQYGSRTEAEALQKHLQAAVSSRAEAIQELQRLVKKRLRGTERVMSVESRPRTADATLFKAYFESLDALYNRLDGVFKEVGMSPTPGKLLGAEPTRKTDGETEYFEQISVGSVPFDFQRTCSAVWELVAAPHRQDGRSEYDGLPDSENSVAVKFDSPLRQESGEELTLTTYQVARRYVDSSRTVVVWRALSEASGALPGMNLDETGWCVTHPPASGGADSTATIVQVCIRLTPMSFQAGHVGKAGEVKRFMDMVVKAAAEDAVEIERMFEQLLLEDWLTTDAQHIDVDGSVASLVS